MEWFLLGCFVLFLVFGPWIFILNLRNRLKHEGKLLDSRLSDLTRRLQEVESALRDLKRTDKHAPAPPPPIQPPARVAEQPAPPAKVIVAETPEPEPAPIASVLPTVD